MPLKSWEESDRLLAKATAPESSQQKELGRYVETVIPEEIPKIVAAAILRRALRDALGLPRPRRLSERYDGLLRFLRRASDPKVEPKNDDEAEAWANYLSLLRRREALSRIKPDEGDIVKTQSGVLAEVSSIGEDGRIYFRGGRGFSAWPDQVELVARGKDCSDQAIEARRQANTTASQRNVSSIWSLAKSKDLAGFWLDLM